MRLPQIYQYASLYMIEEGMMTVEVYHHFSLLERLFISMLKRVFSLLVFLSDGASLIRLY